MENNKEIQEQIRKIKDEYETRPDSYEEEQLSFLDRVNKLISLILNDNSISVYSAFNPEVLEKWKKKRFSRFISNVFKNPKILLYFVFLATITSFLVSEALSFYTIDNVIDGKTYLKAILTEVCFIFLSGYKSKGKLDLMWVGFLRASVFSLMLFVISSETLLHSAKNSSNTKAIAQQVVALEKQILEKEKDVEYYRNRNWAITTKQMINEKSDMLEKLIALKEKQANGANVEVSDIVRYKSYGKAVFRILLLFISTLITRRIFTF